jgi:hypothetical protein
MSFEDISSRRRPSSDLRKDPLSYAYSSNTHSETPSPDSISRQANVAINESIDLPPSEHIDFAPVNDMFTPPSRMRKMAYTNDDDISSDVDSGWDVEISPILKTRESDGVAGVLFMSPGDPTKSAPLQFSKDEGIVDYSSYPRGGRNADEIKEEEMKAQTDKEGHQIVDLSSLRRQVYKTSSDFIEKITDAARRRKVAMTRSRDSLIAKEQEQLRSNAASDEKLQKESNNTSINGDNVTKKSDNSVKTFKARPVPSTTGENGTGGLKGVPKVDKRPATTPFSPLLGARRPQKPKVEALRPPPPEISRERRPISREKKRPQKSSVMDLSTTNKTCPEKKSARKSSDSETSAAFKALPLPASLGANGHGGQAGVPKVPKRPLTVPRSPCLGPRRRAKSAEREKLQERRSSSGQLKSKLPPIRSIPRSTSTSSLRSAESPILLGLKLLAETPERKRGSFVNDENVPPPNSRNQPFELHSTRRAKKRAEYNDTRDDNLACRELQAKRDREKQIKHMQKELKVLRSTL